MLTPHHFTNDQNGYMYYAICELARKGIDQIDAYGIVNILDKREETREKITRAAIEDLITNADLIARNSVEAYMELVETVLNAAFRRETYNKLIECQQLCFNADVKEIQQKIYQTFACFPAHNHHVIRPVFNDEVSVRIKAGQGNGFLLLQAWPLSVLQIRPPFSAHVPRQSGNRD